MSSFTFIHAADLHLDTPFKNISYSESIRKRLQDASLESFSALIDLAIERAVDCIIFAGDLYDGEEVGLRAQFRFFEGLKRASEAGIFSYVLLGNHDPGDIFSAVSEWAEKVHFFSKDKLASHSLIKDGKVLAKIKGRNFSDETSSRTILDEFKDSKAESVPVFSIGVYHGDVRESSSSGAAYAACSVDELLSIPGIDYWALGHLHQFQILREHNPAIVYPGTIQGRSLKPSECGEKGVVLGSVNEGKLEKIEFIPLSNVEFHEHECSPGEHSSMLALISEVRNDVKNNFTNKEPSLKCIRIIMKISGDSVSLFSEQGARDECTSMLGELLSENNIYLSECRINLVTLPDSRLRDEIISACHMELKNISEEDRDGYFSELFANERKLFSSRELYSRDERTCDKLEEEALKLINLSLSSHHEEN